MQNSMTTARQSSASTAFKRMTERLPHKVYSENGEEKVLFPTPMLTHSEIRDLWKGIQKTTGKSVGEEAAKGVSCNLICNPGVNIPTGLIQRLNEQTIGNIVDTLRPAAQKDTTAARYRAFMARVFGLPDTRLSEINRTEFHDGKSESAPIAYTFHFTKKQTLQDLTQQSIARHFNKTLGENLFHSTRMKGDYNLPSDIVLVWIEESKMDALLKNPNTEKLPEVFAAYLKTDRNPKAPKKNIHQKKWKQLLPRAEK